MGWPCKRPRMLCVGFNRDTVKFVGGTDWQSSFKKKFFRMCQTIGDVFFCAPLDERLNMYKRMAKVQGSDQDP